MLTGWSTKTFDGWQIWEAAMSPSFYLFPLLLTWLFLKIHLIWSFPRWAFFLGNSLAVQWLGLGTFTAVAWLQSLARELRSCKLRGAAKQKTKNLFLEPIPYSLHPSLSKSPAPSSLHFIPATCSQNHKDHMLILSHGPDLRFCMLPPLIHLHLSHLLPLHLYFWFNTHIFTSNLPKVKKLKWRTTDAHIDTLHFWDSVILRQGWGIDEYVVLEGWWYLQDTGVVLGNSKSHIRKLRMPEREWELSENRVGFL